MKASWNGRVIAQSDDTIVVEGNHYFPATALDRSLVRASASETTCSWKGVARYYTLVVDGRENPDACWYYPDPLPAADHIRDRVAFWKGVEIA